ncbi:MAG: putative nucleic acid-binding protein [Natronomonas sp.]|uniref:type II toxin-antitoxin system VapC family toxin n=1 Tax=Natronomonas sp. TaxID=2184060 RepID=UPI0039899D83
MIFLDSWIWLEFLFDGEQADEAAAVIQQADSADEVGLITPTVIAEVSYRVRVVDGEETATEAVRAIRDYDHIESLPLVDEIAEYAAELRYKYYDRGSRELSYADCIHLATASVHDDCRALYSGDPDFADVDEIDVVLL